jgi:hypothetical protein
MTNLPESWLTEGLLDAEYKRYKLLAYLQSVEGEFAAQKVYPSLADLGRHYDNLAAFRAAQDSLRAAFPKEVTGADWEEAKLTYRPTLPEPAALVELGEVVEFALPALNDQLELGKQLFNQVEADLSISPLGLLPLSKDVGYVLLHTNRQKEVDIFSYRLSWTHSFSVAARQLEWRFVEQVRHSLVQTFEHI